MSVTVASCKVDMAKVSAADIQVVQDLMHAVHSKEAPLVGTVDRILDKLEEVGLSYRAKLLPRQVGADPSNRDGYGINAEDVHVIGHDIAFLGWSWKVAWGAVCVEETPGSTAIEDFNIALAAGSALMPSVTENSIKYGSLACSHTNMFLRCIADGVPSEDEYCSEDKVLSVQKIERRDPALAEAVRTGMSWQVLSHTVRTLFPGLDDLIQTARNAPSRVARSEHEVQVMLRIQNLAATAQAAGKDPDWGNIRKAVLKSKPRCSDDVRELCAFVGSCGGGQSGAFVQDLQKCHRACSTSDRIIRGPFFLAVAELMPEEEIPLFKIALVKAQYTGPKKSVNKAHECEFIKLGDLSKCSGSWKDKVLRAEELMASARCILDAAGWEKVCTEEQTRTVFLARLDTSLVRWVIGKLDSGILDAKVGSEVVNFFFKDLRGVDSTAVAPESAT